MHVMIGSTLICSDEDCAEALEVVTTLEELDHLVCDGCACTLTVLTVWEVEDVRSAPSLTLVAAQRYDLPLAA